jgi:hypothetical protein
VDICPNPKDKECINSERNLSVDGNKASGGGGSGQQKSGSNNKWRKLEPSEGEKGYIDGKYMKLHYSSGK